MPITVAVNAAVALQAAWHGGFDPIEPQEQAQIGAQAAANKAMRPSIRTVLLDTACWEVDSPKNEKKDNRTRLVAV
jgi:hypothetical protein